MSAYLALLRGINVGGHKKVPMAELRALAGELGLGAARTYIQSGNLLFEGKGTARALGARLERALAERFGFPVEVLVRSADDWRALVAANPLRTLARADPAHVLLALPKTALRKEAATELAVLAQGAERVAAAGGALWIHFASGIARSKLTPALLDRCAGSTVTARNWRTVLELTAMLDA